MTYFAEMKKEAEQVTVQAGMTDLAIRPKPGESFRQPSILLGPYRGSADDGRRALRAHPRDHVQPYLHGSPMRPVSFWGNYYGDRGRP
jgi:hypothetical protein